MCNCLCSVIVLCGMMMMKMERKVVSAARCRDGSRVKFNPYSAKGLGDRLYATLHKMPGEVDYSFCIFLKSKNSPLLKGIFLGFVEICGVLVACNSLSQGP